MFDIFAIGLELMQDWNSERRFERWMARIGFVVAALMVAGFVLFIVQAVSSGQG